MNTYDIDVTITVEAETDEDAQDIVIDVLATDLGIKEYKIHTILGSVNYHGHF